MTLIGKTLVCGEESESVYRLRGQSHVVVKEYNELSRRYDLIWGRRPESYWFLRYPMPGIMPDYLGGVDGEWIATLWGGDPVGSRRGISRDVDAYALVQWLLTVQKSLKLNGLEHRDLNPRNILWDRSNRRFTLIDWSWCRKVDTVERISPKVNYSRYSSSDSESIRLLMHECVLLLIRRLGLIYSPGSSIKRGYTYHPIPFSEYKDIKCHKSAAWSEFKWIADHQEVWSGTKVLDLGCSVGFFSFMFARRGAEVLGVERDRAAFEVADSLRISHSFPAVTFMHEGDIMKAIRRSDWFPGYGDVVLMLNLPMWIERDYGIEYLESLLNEISKRGSILYYQTAHAESRGDYVIQSIRNFNDLEEHIKRGGFKIAGFRKNEDHKGVRYLLKCVPAR